MDVRLVQRHDYATILMPPLLLAAYWAGYLLVGARVPIADGLGWDGKLYGDFARDPFGSLASASDYYANRLLPSLLIWATTTVLGIDLDRPAAIVASFHVYNGVLLIGAALIWRRISRALSLGRGASLLGCAGLFVNWAVLKQYPFAAVQTDATALAFGVATAWAAVERRMAALISIAFIGSFAWNSVLPLCAILVLFPRPSSGGAVDRWLPWVTTTAATALAIVVAVVGHRLQHGAAQISLAALPLSLAALAAYVFYVARSFPTLTLVRTLTLGSPVVISIYCVAWAAAVAVRAEVVTSFGSHGGVLDFQTFVLASLATAIAKPGIFLVAHLAFFGPTIALLLIALPRVIRTAAMHSTGAALFMLAALVMLVNSESRLVTFAYPMLVSFLAATFKDVSMRSAAIFLAASLLLSKAVLPLGLSGLTSYERLEELQAFPWQWMFMNIGPWMGWTGYAINVAVAAVAVALLAPLRRETSTGRTADQGQPLIDPSQRSGRRAGNSAPN